MLAVLTGGGPHGTWAKSVLTESVVAPHVMPVEVTNALRREALRKEITDDVASMTLGLLVNFPVELFPFEPFVERVWQLRHAVSPYDGWYVALAEVLDAPLVTLDAKLARATGPHCEFVTPPRAR